jgi:acetyl-CoA carboxylase, biotin carboxylase subunit
VAFIFDVLASKILIANRGEIVMRVARTCKKLSMIPYGIYSDADQNSLHIKYCEKAINIGGTTAAESYLRSNKIIDAAREMECDLIHPGYGFLAENLEFAELCKKEGFVFVGPSSEALKVSGDKVRAKEIASRVAPVVQGKEVSKNDDALRLAEDIGYPVIVKAAKGGGGRGLRIARTPDELNNVFNSAKNESIISFGSDRLYIEKYLDNPRHIEVQILGDNSRIIHLGERECSVQRRHQKLVEETPSPALTSNSREIITKTAIAIMNEIKYDNAGTVEFLFKDGSFYFMEVNSRIQVEHPITEEVTGIDIVEQQLHIASGDGLTVKQEDVKFTGHALECRINAEHPLSFVPFPGTVKDFVPPEGSGIRVDSALYPGYTIPPFYDSLIGKLICHSENRAETIEKMKQSLLSFRISGIPSTIPFHLSALNDKRFLEGDYNTSFVTGLKPYSIREGEIAAAILSQIPKKIKFVKTSSEQNTWMKSRFNWLPIFGSDQDSFSLLRWIR